MDSSHEVKTISINCIPQGRKKSHFWSEHSTVTSVHENYPPLRGGMTATSSPDCRITGWFPKTTYSWRTARITCSRNRESLKRQEPFRNRPRLIIPLRIKTPSDILCPNTYTAHTGIYIINTYRCIKEPFPYLISLGNQTAILHLNREVMWNNKTVKINQTL